MVEDHFSILKVGPWLTFAFRDAVFALGVIERELLAYRRGVRLSQVREALEAAMLRNPVHWRSYYRGTEDEINLARIYSYRDRCRYYLCVPEVQQNWPNCANLDACPASNVVQSTPAFTVRGDNLGGYRRMPEDIIQGTSELSYRFMPRRAAFRAVRLVRSAQPSTDFQRLAAAHLLAETRRGHRGMIGDRFVLTFRSQR
jgi:hypothetical protein